MFWITQGSDVGDDDDLKDAQGESFRDPIVVAIAEHHYVPVRVSRNSRVLEEAGKLGLPTTHGLYKSRSSRAMAAFWIRSIPAWSPIRKLSRGASDGHIPLFPYRDATLSTTSFRRSLPPPNRLKSAVRGGRSNHLASQYPQRRPGPCVGLLDRKVISKPMELSAFVLDARLIRHQALLRRCPALTRHRRRSRRRLRSWPVRGRRARVPFAAAPDRPERHRNPSRRVQRRGPNRPIAPASPRDILVQSEARRPHSGGQHTSRAGYGCARILAGAKRTVAMIIGAQTPAAYGSCLAPPHCGWGRAVVRRSKLSMRRAAIPAHIPNHGESKPRPNAYRTTGHSIRCGPRVQLRSLRAR